MGDRLTSKLLFLIVVAGTIVAIQLSWVTGLNANLSAPDPEEIRGVWITNVASGVLFAPWGVRRAINTLADLNFNTIYPVIWNGGYTFYPSAVAREVTGRKQAPLFAIAHPGTDVLEEMVRIGHRHQLRIIPWFEYGFMVPPQSNIARQHPDWLTTNADGKTIENSEDRTEHGNVWLNPFHPEVQGFILKAIVEVATNYDVDGIQLDDHFGLPVTLGYDPVTVELYRRSHGGHLPPTDPFDREWMQWRAAQIGIFVERIVRELKSIKPNFTISLSPNPQEFAYSRYLQDWQTWVDRGWIDELVLQVYRNDIDRFASELSRSSVQAARSRIRVAIALLSGTVRNPVDISQLQAQIDVVRDRNFDGISFFYWESLMGYLAPESPYRRSEFLQEVFADRAR